MTGTSDEAIRPQCPVVGIGASAGGVEALSRLFRSMPADAEMAFVIVTHLAPNRESHLAEVIAHASSMPVVTIANDQPVASGRIHVLPHNAILTIDKGILHLDQDTVDRRERTPIDVFFASLAADQGENAVGIVLSGAGTDGTLGLKAIKEKGGLTIAQGSDGSEPRYTGMPTSAIESGIVDLVLPVETIGPRLTAFVRQAKGELDESPAADPNAATAQREIALLLRKRTGHDFTDYKNQTFMRRIDRRRRVLQLPDLAAYMARLREDADEVGALFRDLLIGVTSFFRDARAFERLNALVIPELFAGKGPDDVVRVWVPGCSTGEEVYSIAMLLLEHVDKLPSPPRVQVFGTDIDNAALGVARSGAYPPPLLDAVSPQRLSRFFVKEGMKFVVVPALRDACIFSEHSLIREPPFSRMDLVSCRNLLIYMRADLQERVFPIFHYALKPKGYLFLGTSENATKYRELFTAVDKKERIFQRVPRSAGQVPIRNLGVFSGPIRAEDGRAHEATRLVLNLRQSVEQQVLERFAPAHVVVDREGNIVYYSTRTGKYLEAAPGMPNHQLIASARKSLRLEIRGALKEAMERRRRVERSHVAVEIDDRVQSVNLTVEPIADTGDGGDPLFLVLFTDVGSALNVEEAALSARVSTGEAELERELRDTRERLQATIEEYESSLEELKSANEEMMSVNEELQSTNEELESSKEELESVNEEMQTINDELQRKVEELNRANADLQNVFDVTRIALVFLDRDLRVRNFTPMVTEIFNLIPTDHGRPLSDIVSNLDGELWDDIKSVLATRKPVERRVGRKDNVDTRYLLRVVPYWGRDRDLDGIILTFVDVTSSVQAEAHLHTLVEELNHRVKNMLAVVLALVRISKKGARSLDEFVDILTGRVHSLAKAYDLVAEERWGDVSLHTLLQVELEAFGATGNGRFTFSGPPPTLKPRATLALGIIFHEICTNAVKYGSLSTSSGRISVAAERRNGKSGPVLLLRWKESGGPPVTSPARPGFGTELIRREVEGELKGSVAFDYARDGLEVVLTAPLDPEIMRVEAEPGN